MVKTSANLTDPKEPISQIEPFALDPAAASEPTAFVVSFIQDGVRYEYRVAVRQGFWHEVVQLAKACKVHLAESSPCFETWLLFHLDGPTTRSDLHNGDAAKTAVEKALGRA